MPYSVETQRFSRWEQDLSLRDALPISNLPISKGLSRRITQAQVADDIAFAPDPELVW